MSILTRAAASRRALEIAAKERSEETRGPWKVTAVHLRPLLLTVPQPFNPEDTTGPQSMYGAYRWERWPRLGPLPPAWLVELEVMEERSARTFEVLLAMHDGRVLARGTSVRFNP